MNARIVCPRPVMTASVWERLMAYIKACPMEVGGLGEVELANGQLVVRDVFLLEQKVTTATTSLDRGAVARFVADWHRRGRDINTLRFWWHSHSDMPVFWSDTDLATIRELSEDGWCLALVGNRKGETRTRLAVGGPMPVAIDQLEVEVLSEVSAEVMRRAEQEVRTKVTTGLSWGFGRRPKPVIEPGFDAGIESLDFGLGEDKS